MTYVNSINKGIARALVQEVSNTYHKPCSCTIDFLIDVLKGSPLSFVKNGCKHCEKLHQLIELVLNYDEFELEEEEEQSTFQVDLTLPPTPREEMITYAKFLDPTKLFYFNTPQEGDL